MNSVLQAAERRNNVAAAGGAAATHHGKFYPNTHTTNMLLLRKLTLATFTLFYIAKRYALWKIVPDPVYKDLAVLELNI